MTRQRDQPPDPAGVRVRTAGPEDREFVLALAADLHAFGPPPWRDVEQMRAVDASVNGDAIDGIPPDATVLIAEDGEGIRLGFIHLCEEDDYYLGPCGHVGDVVVAHEARGRGVGHALMSAAEVWARERGYRLLSLNVFLENRRAQSLYESLGFRAETVRHVKIFN